MSDSDAPPGVGNGARLDEVAATDTPALDAPQSDDPAHRRRLLVSVLSIVGAAVFALGCVILVATACTLTVQRVVESAGGAATATRDRWPEVGWYVAGAVAVFVGTVMGFAALSRLRRTNASVQSGTGPAAYDLYLTGIGYALVLLTSLNFVALASLAYIGQLDKILDADFVRATGAAAAADKDPAATTQPSKAEQTSQMYRLLLMLFAPGFAALGAMFFTANELYLKRSSLGRLRGVARRPRPAGEGSADPTTSDGRPVGSGERTVATGTAVAPPSEEPKAGQDKQVLDVSTRSSETTVQQPAGGPLLLETTDVAREPAEAFDSDKFWGGLWFRVGEALLFTLVLFLIVAGATGRNGSFLLLLSLLMGMFVRTGETLIAGFARKLFNAAEAIVK